MILAIDVDYSEDSAIAAGVTFQDWSNESPAGTFISSVSPIHAYIPGQFYKRELPCIDALLKEHNLYPDIIVVDGFVTLDTEGKPGLGHYLYEHLNRAVTVIGVAKNPFKNMPEEFKLYRGESSKPLYVSSVGIPLEEAKKNIQSMAGNYRFPTLLKQVDSLCRRPEELSV